MYRWLTTLVPTVYRLLRALQLELFVDDAFEFAVRLCAADHPAVDEKGRRAVDACVFAGFRVGVDLRAVLVRVDARVELRRVGADLGGMRLQIGVSQLGWIGEQLVVVLPELALLGRALRRLGGRTRV